MEATVCLIQKVEVQLEILQGAWGLGHQKDRSSSNIHKT